MDIFRFFKPKPPVLLRCTHCYYEFDIPHKEVPLLIKRNKNDTVCPVKEPCHICHIGFMIPVNYTHNGKLYLFSKIKPKIKNMDPNTVFQRIIEATHEQNFYTFGLFE